MHRAVCLFTSQLWLVLIAPIQGRMAGLSWPAGIEYINVSVAAVGPSGHTFLKILEKVSILQDIEIP